MERQLGHERLLVNELIEEGDPKAWFARGFVLHNEEVLALVDAGVFADPDWVLRLMSALHNRYVSSLHAYRTGGPISTRWRDAWATCDEADGRRPSHRILIGAVAATRAHLSEDMPAALAEVHQTHYRRRREYTESRADYVRIAAAVGPAADRCLAEMPTAPRLLRRPLRLLPRLRQLMVRSVFFDFDADRMRAFDRGYDLTRRSA